MKGIFRDPRRELDEELAFHLEERVAEAIARGVPPGKARKEALRRMGDLDRARAACARIDARRARGERWSLRLEELRQDLVLAVRSLKRRPTFTAGVVLTLALGLGANSAIFATLDALVLRPLPGIERPEELLQDSGNVSLPALRDLREQSRLLEVAGFGQRTFALERGAAARGEIVSGNYFQTLGVRAALGRLLTKDDDRPGAPAVVVLRHEFWRREMEADPHVLGKTLRLNGGSATVVGVAAPAFRGTQLQRPPDLWIPTADFPQLAPSAVPPLDPEQRTWGWLTVVARLRPGATPAAAEAELNRLTARMLEAEPDQVHHAFQLEPAAVAATGVGRAALVLFSAVLSAVVLAVLLLACANVANLMLSRASSRRQEIGVRLALGATRRRLLRQLLIEAFALAVLGGGAGLGLAAFAAAALSGLHLPDGAVLPDLELLGNGRAIAFTAALSLCATVLFGLPAALAATRLQLVDSLKEAGADGRTRGRLRDLLLVSQVSLSLLLLVGAGLFLRGLQRGFEVDPGFRPSKLAFATVDVSLVHHAPAQAAAEYREIAREVRGLPGVRDAAWTSALPLSENEDIAIARPEGYQARPDEDMWIETQRVSDRLFATLGLSLIAGRGFEQREPAPVMVVTRGAERRFFPGGALGRHMVLWHGGPPIEIVGVVADARFHTLAGEPRPLAYLPLDREPPLDQLTLLVRAEADPAALARVLRSAIENAAPGVPVLAAGTLDDQLRDLLAPQRMGLFFLAAFAALGLMLAFIGTAAATAFVLEQRKHELGVRMALGADGPRILRMVLSETLGRIAIGVVLGAVIALPAARGVTGLLYGLRPWDPVTFAVASAILLLAGALAALLPARRAVRVDPMITLRGE
jgi:predicted permease